MLLLLACAEPSPSVGGLDSATDADGTWEVPGDEATPPLGAEEATQALQAALDREIPLAQDVLDLYTTLMGAGDELCPGTTLILAEPLGCTSTSGYWYAGISGYGEQGTEEPVFRRVGMYGDMQIETPEGWRFGMGGYVDHSYRYENEGQPEAVDSLRGSFPWTGEDETAPGVGALVELTARGLGNDRELAVTGGYAWGDPPLQFDTFAIGALTCLPETATGAIRMRDSTGHWYKLDFGVECEDACGDLSWNDSEELGSACVDLGPFFDHVTTRMLEG